MGRIAPGQVAEASKDVAGQWARRLSQPPGERPRCRDDVGADVPRNTSALTPALSRMGETQESVRHYYGRQ
jgi:hypothetical protein